MTLPFILAQSALDSAKETLDTFGWNVWGFLSQVISFVIVALLLKKFAYQPVLKVLEERRQRIQEGLLNADKIKQQLADAEKRHADILAQANAQAQKMIDEARQSASTVAERRTQEAIAEAEQILAKAQEASRIEREKQMVELKRQLGRLVVETTSKVTGKVLTPDDQRRLQEETAREVAA